MDINHITGTIGLTGAGIAGIAYLPQIRHLITEHCSAGISRSAFGLWMLASILITTHAITMRDLTFITLGGIQIAAISTVLILSGRYRNLACPTHLNAQTRLAPIDHSKHPG